MSPRADNPGGGRPAEGQRRWLWPLLAWIVVVAAQLWVVRGAGTDIPFHDQWDIEGRWLYPAWVDGRLGLWDLFTPGNENRITWTLGLDLGLFVLNGSQWDPLVQMVAGAILRGTCGWLLAWRLARGLRRGGQIAVAAGVAVAFLPHLAWHNVLWGIETHAGFVLGFALLTFVLLEPPERTPWRTLAGLLAGAAGFVAMAPGLLVPLALLGLALVRAAERREWGRRLWREAWPALALLVLALWSRVQVPQHAGLEPTSIRQLLTATARALAWPHVGQPWAAVVLNLPVAAAVLGRVLGRRRGATGEDFVLLLAGWAVAVALAIGWARGGSGELLAGIPSRYVDFLVLLPLANVWLVVVLAREFAGARPRLKFAAITWGAFLLVGWIGLSAEMMRYILVPRFQDREAPVRLARAFQRSGDAAEFAGQPRLLVPHPNAESVRVVLNDPRVRGALPPSLQPDVPPGPLSRGVRVLLGR